MVIQVAAMCFCITAAVAALKLSEQSGEAALLENAWAYLHPFIDKAIHLDVVSAGFSDVSGVEIQIVLSALQMRFSNTWTNSFDNTLEV